MSFANPSDLATGGQKISSRYRRLLQLIAGAAFGMSTTSSQPPWVSMPGQASSASDSAKTLIWQLEARLHHGLRTVRATLIFDSNGVEFRSEQRFSHRWPFIEIQSFDLTPHRFVLISYENRGRYLPGDRRFRFDLSQAINSIVAAELTQRVAKPVRNGEPVPSERGFATLGTRRTGGSNGTLRFHDDGIDYLTASKQDGRTWRWLFWKEGTTDQSVVLNFNQCEYAAFIGALQAMTGPNWTNLKRER